MGGGYLKGVGDTDTGETGERILELIRRALHHPAVQKEPRLRSAGTRVCGVKW